MRRQGQKGITLTELLVVLAVVGLFAVITIPAFNDFLKAFKVSTTAQQVQGIMRLGRQRAVARKRVVAAMVNPSAETYDAWDDEDEDGDKDPNADERSIRPLQPVPQAVDIVDVYSNQGQVTEGDGEIVFFLRSDGTIEREECADPCQESQWCIRLQMPINSRRTDRWVVFARQSGKVTLNKLSEADAPENNNDYCK